MPPRKNDILKSQEGSALLNVLAVIFILLTIFSAVFAHALNRFSVLKKDINMAKARYLSEAGLQRYLSYLDREEIDLTSRNLLEYNIEISDKNNFRLSARLFGAYLMVRSIGTHKSIADTIYALVGKLPGKEYNFAIINASSVYPLTLAGRTKITGDIKMGQGGVTKGEIDGQYFQFEDLNEGLILPALDTVNFGLDRDFLKRYLDEIPNRSDNHDRFIQGSLVLNEKSIENLKGSSIVLIENNLEINPDIPLILDDPITLIAKGSIEIKGTTRLSGPLEIISSGYINLSEGAVLEGCLLVAEDSVIVRGGAKYSGQILSSGKITIKDNARILHPSLVYSYYPGYSSDERQIVFENKSVAEGIVVMDSTLDNNREEYNRILIEDYAAITGILQSEECIEMRGSLFGIAVTSRFLYVKDQSIYVNWLGNAVIDRSKLDFIPIMPVNSTGVDDYGIFKKYN